ncbi:MAG: radical SAM protein [Candidatus Bathyarchaeia archaeon]|nr:radical SAM protein [Candidatus Bathyarchaeota archaeon]
MDYPEALQIEVTNRCNFSCQMCVRRVWDAKPTDLNMDLYKRVAESAFPHLKRLVLYGLGEPLINPNIIEMLKIAREKTSRDSEIKISTNGSLLNPRLAEKILRLGVNNVSFSIDTADIAKLKYIREGSEPTILLKNFRHIARLKRLSGGSFKLGIEAVVMKSNFMDLPELIKEASNENADYILVSHVIPYTRWTFQNAVYITLSKKPFEIVRSTLDYGRRIILEAIYETFCNVYGINTELKASKIIEGFWREAEKSGYWINLPLLFESMEKIAMIRDVERVFEETQKMAHEYGIELALPNLYPDARDRRCPYVEKATAVIRSDGLVTPCLEFAYKHTVYVNAHIKTVNSIILGDLRSESINEVWNRENYVRFREVRLRMPENIPWCGDCPYSASKCFFTENNSMDCYTNEPGCNECLYSVNLAQCNI